MRAGQLQGAGQAWEQEQAGTWAQAASPWALPASGLWPGGSGLAGVSLGGGTALWLWPGLWCQTVVSSCLALSLASSGPWASCLPVKGLQDCKVRECLLVPSTGPGEKDLGKGN